MTRTEAIAEAIRQGASAVDAKAIGATLPDDCSFRTPGFSGPAIILNRCSMLAKLRGYEAEARAALEDLHHVADDEADALEDDWREASERLAEMLKDYGLTS